MAQEPESQMKNPSKDITSSAASPKPHVPSTWDLIGQTVMVVLTNAVPIYGVFKLGWHAFILVLMFILEGFVVLFSDAVKVALNKHPKRDTKVILFFEFVFIFFFGFFALVVFGPADMEGISIPAKYRLVKSLFAAQLQTPLLFMIGFRLLRLMKDLIAGGVFGDRYFKKPLQLSGGGWMLLLFMAVMLTPIIAKSGPNPLAGLAALVALKMLGETFGVWVEKIASKIN